MAGHSKWANTKHRKASQDVKKSKIFTKIIRLLTITAKSGGNNPNTNTHLKTIIDKALSYNIPRDVIKKAIHKNIINTENSQLKYIKYGGYGPQGTAIILECISNNKNRTVSEIRYILSKFKYTLKPISSIQYLFKKRINVYYQYNNNKKIIESICEKYNIKNMTNIKNNNIKINTNHTLFKIIKSELHKLGIIPKDIVFFMIPSVIVPLNEKEKLIFTNLIMKLQSNVDIKNIYHNTSIIIKNNF